MTALIPYSLLLLVITILAIMASKIFNLLWTLLMSSYSLSLPALLWGGGAFGFPSFIPSGPTSPMNFYYWFFIIAVITLIVSFAILAFRRLAVWGKFDENVAQDMNTDFWGQFKWVLVLIFMTLLTPIVIWICYSLLMLGVFFFMTLAGQNTMFVSITKEEYDTLLAVFKSDIDILKNMDASELQAVIGNLLSQEVKVREFLTSVGWSVQQADQFIAALNGINNNFAASFNDLKLALNNISFQGIGFDSPFTSDVFTNLSSAVLQFTAESITASTDPATQTVTWNYSLFAGWKFVFGSFEASGYNFGALCQYIYGDNVPAIVEDWAKARGIFQYFGYGSGQTAMLQNLQSSGIIDSSWTTIVDRLKGSSLYIINNKSYDLGYLTFRSGYEVGLKTCPLLIYLNDLISGQTGMRDVSTYFSLNCTLLLANLAGIFAGNTLIQQGMAFPWMGVAMVIVGSIMVAVSLVGFVGFGITFIINAIVWFAGFRLMVKPLFGMVVFVWESFFEAMWYFLLLLPAIGASVADTNKEIYKNTWKQCLGKMSATLIMWAGLIMMFVALFQVSNVCDMILTSIKESNPDFTDIIPIKIEWDPTILAWLLGSKVTITAFIINVPPIIKFILALVVMSSAFKLMQKLGQFAFGDVYSDMGNRLLSPINSVVPGFSQAAGSIKQSGMGMARGFGGGIAKKTAPNVKKWAAAKATRRDQNKLKNSITRTQDKLSAGQDAYLEQSQLVSTLQTQVNASAPGSKQRLKLESQLRKEQATQQKIAFNNAELSQQLDQKEKLYEAAQAYYAAKGTKMRDQGKLAVEDYNKQQQYMEDLHEAKRQNGGI